MSRCRRTFAGAALPSMPAPGDRAVGYREGDFRGLIRISNPVHAQAVR